MDMRPTEGDENPRGPEAFDKTLGKAGPGAAADQGVRPTFAGFDGAPYKVVTIYIRGLEFA